MVLLLFLFVCMFFVYLLLTIKIDFLRHGEADRQTGILTSTEITINIFCILEMTRFS